MIKNKGPQISSTPCVENGKEVVRNRFVAHTIKRDRSASGWYVFLHAIPRRFPVFTLRPHYRALPACLLSVVWLLKRPCSVR